MKKLFPEKKITRKGILEFLDKKGFYVVLILCIAIVGAAAVIVTTNKLYSPSPDYNAEKIIPEGLDDDLVSDVEVEPEDSPIDVAAVHPEANATENAAAGDEKAVAGSDSSKAAAVNTDKTAVEKTDKSASQPEKKEAATESSGIKPATQNQTQKFIMPVVGGVTYAFAQDRLVYSKTLEEWRTHSGIDLAAERGEPVKVVADGFVSDIKNDPRFGVTIIVDHENGLKTVYANLASDEMVSPNQKLKQGDILGCVGNTALFESAEQSHLHFEVLKNNEPLDPEEYLPTDTLQEIG